MHPVFPDEHTGSERRRGVLGVTVSASSGARAPRPLGRLPAGCSRWRSGQPPSQTVLGSEAMWPSVQDEAPQQVAGRRMCGWLRRLGGRVARCPRRSAGLRVLAFGDLPVPEGARPSVSWERRSDPQSTHGRGEGTPRHQDRLRRVVRGAGGAVPGAGAARVCGGKEPRGTRTAEGSPSAAHDPTPRSRRLAACSSP